MKLTFATVVFSEEIGSLRLQARSMAKYLDADSVGEILVFVNDVKERECLKHFTELRSSYGPLSGLVRIMRSSEVFPNDEHLKNGTDLDRLPSSHKSRYPHRINKMGWGGFNGWKMQQAFKLASGRTAKCEFVVILDAKDFFLKKTSFVDFVFQEKALVRLGQPNERHLKWLPDSYEAVGIRFSNSELGSVLPNTTPICVPRELLRYAAQELENEHGYSVAQYFALECRNATEFGIIYAAAVKSKDSIKSWFKRHDFIKHATYGSFDLVQIRAVLNQLDEHDISMVAIHRKSWTLLEDQDWTSIGRTLISKGIFSTELEFSEFKAEIIRQSA